MIEKGGALAILLVEDSEADAELVSRELRRLGRAIEFERVDTEDAMRAALLRRGWDVVVSDWSMPTFSGQAAISLLAELQLDLPFIIVSGTIGEEHAVAAMRAGADDFVVKDKLGRLTPAIERELRDRDTRRARREAELARREAELRFQRLFDSDVTGVTIGDVGGLINEANDAFLEMVGYTRDDLVAGAVNCLEMTPVEWRAESRAVNEELRAGEIVRPFEKEYVRRDGTRVPVLVSVVPLDASRVLTIVADLTARKLAERANVALEEQLRQAQKMEAIGRLAGGIAHDFNNLLSVVLSYSSMLISDLREGDPIREDIQQIHLAGTRAADLTRQLLTFGRQRVVEPKVIDLPTLLSGMDKMLRRLVGADVELTFIFDESTGRVRADPGSIEQVVMNLVINARDAMPVGGKLTVETTNVVLDRAHASAHVGAEPGRHVVLSVADTGIGMDDATLARIFEPFFTTKELGKGTGLGLSTVFGIVQQSGGHISVDSEPGVGTTFKVYLPRVDATTDAPRPHGATALRGSETILLVEDEDPVRDVARDVLRRHGYTVLDARSAGEALLLCERHAGPIHLLLSDIVMPQMSGPELAKRLVQSRPTMSVLFMSGYTDDTALRHGVKDGGFAYLQKPITVEALTRRVRDVLEENRGGA